MEKDIRSKKRRRGLRGGLVLSFLVVGAVGYFWGALPSVGRLKNEYPVSVPQGRGEPPRIVWERKLPRGWVRLKEISKPAIWAVVVSEDWAFYQHEGLDLEQLKESMETNWKRGRLARGGSTISQQVVKNAFLTREKTFARKFKELILTLQMEQILGKHRILETYFNVVEWGDGIYGIRQASRVYFGKSPSELSASEGAFLAMLLPSPIRYSQSYRKGELTEFARNRMESILDKLVQAGILSSEDAEREKQTPIQFSFTQ